MGATVPTTEIPVTPDYVEKLLKLLIEEQRITIATLIEIRTLLDSP